MTAPVRVLLVDDHDLLRGGLAAILGTEAEIEVVGEAADGPSAVVAARALAPDVVLMDIEMPGGDGLTATREILDHCPDTRVLILTTFDLDEYVLAALRSGASGFLLKSTPPARFADAVRSCAAGETLLAPSVVRRLIDGYIQRPPPRAAATIPPALRDFTPREIEVLRALASGMSNAEIGAQLYLAEATVKTHVTHILAKLELRDRLQAVVYAYRIGLVQADDR